MQKTAAMRFSRLLFILTATLLSVSCKDNGDKYAFQYITFKQDLPFERGAEHPMCSFDINVLKAHGTDTIFADAFNRDISETLFSMSTTDVKRAMTVYLDTIINRFKNDNLEQKAYARANNTEAIDIDYELIISTDISYGNHKDIVGCHINWYQYTGGAHGSTFISYRNYRIEDGSLVTLSDYFKPGFEERLIPVLDKLLLNHAGCSSRDELDEYGYFSSVPMYVPEQFEIMEDSVSFIFNQYDIAPYSTGITVLTVANSQIRDIIK